jgi:multiple sugar transport system substrate-binding protein
MRRLIPIILLLVFLTACRDAPGPEAVDTAPAVTQTEQVTITLAVEGSSLNRYRPLIEAFEEENPHIRVRLVNTGEVADADESGIRALATSFDVFPYSPNRQGETQYLLDLRPLLDLDPQFEPADFLPGLLPLTTEPLWAIPTGAAYYLTFYDRSAFMAAGLPPPDLDWTTDDFLDAALALTVREGNEVTRWGYVPGQLRYPPLLASQLAGPLTTPDGGLRLADPDVVTAVQWLSDLFTLHEVSPWLEEYKPAERRSGSGGPTAFVLINSGQAALWHFTHLLFEAADENVGVTTMPHGAHGLAAEPIVSGFAASRGTANPEAAWQLLHFLSRQPPQEVWTDMVTPARRSVAAANNYWEQLPENLAPALQYTAENSAAPRITLPAANQLQEAIAAHIDDDVPAAVALGQLPPPTAVPETEPEVVVVPTVPAEDDEETIRITFISNFSFIDTHRRLANQFSEENPAIRVTLSEGIDYALTPLHRIAGGDCFLGGAYYLEDDETRAALLPLDPLLALDNTLQVENFYPIMVEPFLLDGQLWGIPAGASGPYMEYNRQIFEEAGIPPPALDWTLDDFLEIAQRLTMGEGESKQYGYVETWPYMQIGFAQAFGVRVVDNSVNPPRFDFAAAADMITWYANLVRLYEVQPLIHGSRPHYDPVESQAFEALIREGRVAMWPGGGAAGITFGNRDPLDFEVERASLPLSPGGYHAIWPTAYYILADSPTPQRQACWEWIKFLSTQPEAVRPVSSDTRLSSVRVLPAHIETAESEAFLSQVGPTMAAILHHTMSAALPADSSMTSDWFFGSLAWMNPGFYWLRDAYKAAATGQASVTDTLANVDTKFSQYRQCVLEQDAFEDYNLWRACLLEVDADAAWLFPERAD